MGADMYLNPPDPPRQDRVVVKMLRSGRVIRILGPYTATRAVSIRRRLIEEDANPEVTYSVRKMERD